MICQFINKLKGLKLSLHGASAHSGIVNVLSKLRGSGLGFEIGDLFDPVRFARICTNRAISGIQRRGWHHFKHTRLGKCGSLDAWEVLKNTFWIVLVHFLHLLLLFQHFSFKLEQSLSCVKRKKTSTFPIISSAFRFSTCV